MPKSLAMQPAHGQDHSDRAFVRSLFQTEIHGFYQANLDFNNLAQCPTLAVTDGNVTYTGTPERTNPGVADLVCDANHVLSGSAQIPCDIVGAWTGSLGSCIRMQYP